MLDIESIIETLRARKTGANGKTPLKNLGYISCADAIQLKHVPFYEPCLVLVLSGSKTLSDGRKTIAGDAGDLLAVPGPSSYDLRNEPDKRTRRYSALIIPFRREHLDRLSRTHALMHQVPFSPVGILKFSDDKTLQASVAHYLTTVGNAKLQTHRLMEILLVLASKNPALLSFASDAGSWSGRVRAILAADLAHPWELSEVCERLATSESTLRRNLRREDAGFRDILYELRLSAALMQLLQTALPIYRVAYDCGYQSVSRFTSNFRKRFGVTPKQIRLSVTGGERRMASGGRF